MLPAMVVGARVASVHWVVIRLSGIHRSVGGVYIIAILNILLGESILSQAVDVSEFDQPLALARSYLQAGRRELAEFVFRQVLEKSPDHPEALHLMGIVHLQAGRHEAAEDCLRRAIAQDPVRADAYNDLGAILVAMGRRDEAADCYRHALELRPDFAEAGINLGAILYQSGRLDAARECYENTLSAHPDCVDAHFNLGVVLSALERPGDALAHFQAVIAACPDRVEAHEHLRDAYRALKRLDDAASVAREVARLRPDGFEAWYVLGGLLQQLEQADEAVRCLRRAVALKPDHVWALYNLGTSLDAAGQSDAAVDTLREAMRLAPDNATIPMRLALLFRALRRVDEASALAELALVLKPDDAHALNTLGLVRMSQGRMEEAAAHYLRAAEVRPDMALPLVNMACLHSLTGNQEERRRYFRLALERAPGDALIRFSYALTQLLLGEWADGWRNYAHRPNITRISGTYFLDAPLPRDLSGKRVLIQMDQGLGDELLFLRFARVLKERGAWVAYRPHPKLASFVSRVPFIDVAVGKADPEALDYRLSVCDLALATDMRESAEIPPPVPLAASVGVMRQALQRLEAAGPGPYIGVTWRGGTTKEEFSKWNVLYKEIAIPRLAELLRDLPGQVLVLQRKPRAGEIAELAEALGRPVHDFTDLNEQLEVMLALLSRIEEYVTVSNTNVHIRAGAGRISRVLIPYPPDWRWMAEGRSPWYPDIPTYRQTERMDWDPALAVLRGDLAAALGGDAGRRE